MMYTLRKEIEMWGIGTNSEVRIGVDNKYGECLIASISIKDLFEGKHKTLLNKKVANVFKGDENPNAIIFIINSKR